MKSKLNNTERWVLAIVVAIVVDTVWRKPAVAVPLLLTMALGYAASAGAKRWALRQADYVRGICQAQRWVLGGLFLLLWLQILGLYPGGDLDVMDRGVLLTLILFDSAERKYSAAKLRLAGRAGVPSGNNGAVAI